MSKYDCEICGGRGTIWLPRYARPMVFAGPSGAASMESAAAEFPCPECKADSPSFDRIDVVGEFIAAASDINDARFDDHVKEGLAHKLARELLSRGLITFERGRENTRNMTVPWKATVAAVAPKHVATLEARIASRQFEVAAELITLTEEQIANWGSHYHGREGGSVGKWQALEWLDAAFKKLREARQSKATNSGGK